MNCEEQYSQALVHSVQHVEREGVVLVLLLSGGCLVGTVSLPLSIICPTLITRRDAGHQSIS
jgi:hypothetical protein